MPVVGGEGTGSGVAKFEAATLGQFLRSHEDTIGVPNCKGLARPVFEMKASPVSQGAYTLMPGASPGRSALWLFTTTKMRSQVRVCVSGLMVGQDCHLLRQGIRTLV